MDSAPQLSRELHGLPPGCVLGLNYTCMHDSAIAIVGPDGAVLFACALERLSRTKQDGRWPEALLRGVPWNRIDRIAVAGLQVGDANRLGESEENRSWPLPKRAGDRPLDTFAYPAVWRERLESLPQPVVHYDHHECHAASTYYLSSHDEALVVTCDAGAYQCPWNAASYRAEGERIELRGGMHFQRFLTPAHLYTLVTGLIGLTPNRHEGKVTGLAARGVVSDTDIARFEEIAWPMADELGLLVRWDMALDTEFAPTVVLNSARRQAWRHELAWLDDAQLAACVQRVAERCGVEMVRHARGLAGGEPSHVCLAGGFFANVRVNQVIAEDGFDSVFIAPPMTDDGLALGAALLAHVERGGSRPSGRPTMFLGPAISPDDADGVLVAVGVTATRTSSLAEQVAELLADGQVVAVARGRMEFGPRALGHRSVLSSATDPAINDWLNAKLLRTEYMPFAPMLLERNAEASIAGGYRDVAEAARFMTITVDCTPEFAAATPAVVHVDGTARPQVLHDGDESFCEAVLAAYEQRTGLHAIVNTSFNVHEEPITCTTKDALVAFAQTELDALVLGDALVLRVGNEVALDGLAERAAASGRELRNLPSELAHSRWVDHLAQDSRRMRSWITELEEAREWHTKTLEETKAAHAELLAGNGRLEAERTALAEELGQTRARITELQGSSRELKASRVELEARIAELQSSLSELCDRSDRLEQELEALRSSRWVRIGRRFRVLHNEEGAC